MSLGIVAGQVSPVPEEGFKGKRLVTCVGRYSTSGGVNGVIAIGATNFQVEAAADGRVPAMFNGRFKKIRIFVITNTRNAANTIRAEVGGVGVGAILSIPAGQVGQFEIAEINAEFTQSQLIAIAWSGAGTGSIQYCLTFEIEFDFPAFDFGENSFFMYGYDSYSTNVGTGNVNFPAAQCGVNSQVTGSITAWRAPFDGEILMYATWAVNDSADPSTSQMRYQKNGVTEDFVNIIGHGASTAKFEQRRIPSSTEEFVKGDDINFQVQMQTNGNYCMFFALIRFDLL